MISASDRENAVLLIDEAIKSGVSCKKACERLGITEPNIGVRHLVLDCKREMTKL